MYMYAVRVLVLGRAVRVLRPLRAGAAGRAATRAVVALRAARAVERVEEGAQARELVDRELKEFRVVVPTSGWQALGHAYVLNAARTWWSSSPLGWRGPSPAR